MKISFLIYNVYGIGGTIRSTVNLSTALAEAGHTVEIASVYRTQDEPALDLGPAVTIRPLIEWRRGRPGYARRNLSALRPSTMWQDAGVAFGPLAPSRLTDERVAAFLRDTDADVVIATRPVLNGYLARYGERRYLRVGQEHLTLEMHPERQRADQNRALAELDAFVTVSEKDAAHYREALPGVATRITCIPNAVPTPQTQPVTRNTKTIVAAGRLTRVKRYDRLIDAFAKVAPDYPDWSLRIYGRGKQAGALRRRIDRLGLYDQVRLMGPVSPIETEWVKGELAAVSSDNEAFGMTIVEAMHCGLPVVATDCPHGPGEIINHGGDGLLVPLEGGVNALADAMWILMSSADRRRAMSVRAREKAARYVPELIAERYVRLFEELRPARTTPTPPRRTMGHWLRETVRTPAGSALRRVRRATRDETPARKAPSARCVVRPDGSPVFQLATDRLPRGRHQLVLRRRRGKRDNELRLPLPPLSTARDGRLEVVLDRAEHQLTEGRWDLYLVPTSRPGKRGDTGRLRAEGERVEQGELLALPLRTGVEGVSAWIPYVTVEGNLSVRTWLRPVHAEISRVRMSERELTVGVTLHGAVAPTAKPRVRAVRRDDPDMGVECAVEFLPEGHSDGDLLFTVPLAELLSGWDGGDQVLWDLHLEPVPGATPVLVSRIRGDAADRKSTDVIPAARLRDVARPARIRPYYTVRNELALSVRALGGTRQPAQSTDGASGAAGQQTAA